VAVDPDLGRVGEVRADLDETQPEVLVEHVEVEARHPALGLVEAVVDRPRGVGGALVALEDPLELLGDEDGDYSGAGLRRQGLHEVDLPLALLGPDQGDAVPVGEVRHRLAEPVPDLLEHRRRGDGQLQVVLHEPDHLPAHLEVGDVGVEVEAVEALQVQSDVAVEEVVHIEGLPCGRSLHSSRHHDHLHEGSLGPTSGAPNLRHSPTLRPRRSEAGLIRRLVSFAFGAERRGARPALNSTFAVSPSRERGGRPPGEGLDTTLLGRRTT
jgi:hypothetical protein